MLAQLVRCGPHQSLPLNWWLSYRCCCCYCLTCSLLPDQTSFGRCLSRGLETSLLFCVHIMMYIKTGERLYYYTARACWRERQTNIRARAKYFWRFARVYHSRQKCKFPPFFSARARKNNMHVNAMPQKSQINSTSRISVASCTLAF